MKITKQKSQAIETEYQMSVDLSKRLFQFYMDDQFKHDQLDGCLKDQDHSDFTQTLNRVFLNVTIDKLSKSKSKRIQILIDQIGRHDFENYRIFFRITGHLNEKTPTELVAGFHRGGKNIYIDISKVNAKDWTVIFIHELAHLADEKLSSASQVYANEKWVAEFFEWSKKTESIADLPTDVQNRLVQWIQSGLDRGLLFEYRAWHEAILIYNEMREHNEIPESPFIEFGKSQLDPNKSLQAGLFEFLDRNSNDPKEQIFSVPLIQNALKYVRSKLRKQFSN